jgi:tetratricopeptide (TPR) repeat protein
VGLPTWLIPATVAVLAVGVPMLVATGHHERRRLVERSTGVMRTTPQQGLTRHLRWRKTLLAGSLAFAGLAVLTGAYMAMRLLGIGPLGTLLTKGAFAERDVVVIADFQNQTRDSLLGRTIQELLRIDLEQSPVVTVLSQERVADALRRMQRAPNTTLTPVVAQELAQREGSKGLLTGEVAALGGGYVVTARLVNAATGETLAAQRATADSPDALVSAVDRVSRGLRERIGESLRRVQGGRPLEAVTTASLEALQKYMRATAAAYAGEGARSIELLREAIHLDTNFAMAYRRLGAHLRNFGAPRDQVVQAATKAFELRQNLPENERLLAEASYYAWVTEDDQRAIAAYRALLEQYPTNVIAWNNLGTAYVRLRRWPEAESVYARAIALGNSGGRQPLMGALVADGKIDEAEDVFVRWRQAFPHHSFAPSYQAQFALLHGDYSGAEAIIREAVPAWRAGGPTTRYYAAGWLQGFAQLRGRIREAQRQAVEVAAANRENGMDLLPKVIRDAVDGLGLAVFHGRGQAGALATFEAVAGSGGLDSVPPVARGYPTLVQYCAMAGDVAHARQYSDRYQREVTSEGPRTRAQALRYMRGMVALAEHRWPEAIAELRTWQDSASTLDLVEVGYAYDVAGQGDSAIVVYERWLATPGWRAFWDAWWLPRTLRRLGELHEARGDRRQAREYYQRFADLWKNADIEFQPMVREARAKAARLGGG